MKKKPNEIREELRKKMSVKYKQDVEHWKTLAQENADSYFKALKKLQELSDENIKLKEQIEVQREWIERLMEFIDMPDDKRAIAVKQYVELHEMSEQFKELFSPYFDTLHKLHLLSNS